MHLFKILISGVVLTSAGCANSQFGVTGRVFNGSTGRPAADALVSVQRRGNFLGETRTNADGRFRITGISEIKPGPDGRVVSNMVVVSLPAAAPTVAPVVVPVEPFGVTRLRVTLPTAAPLRVTVTDTKGHPVPDATVVAPRAWRSKKRMFDVETVLWKDRNSPLAGGRRTGHDGRTLVPNLPAGATVRLAARKEGYADTVITVHARPPLETFAPTHRNWQPQRPVLAPAEEIRIRLSRETIVTGTIRLGDEPLVGVTNWWVKMQGIHAPWIELDQWRRAHPDLAGRFEIRNVPALEILGEPKYGINIDIYQCGELPPGITAQYVPPQSGWDLLVTIERGGRIERWISYVDAFRRGFTGAEGEPIQHDLRLEPLALLRGKARPRSLLIYPNPKSVYGDWKLRVGSDGSFELPVPTGTVTLKIDGKEVTVADLQPHEVRQLDR